MNHNTQLAIGELSHQIGIKPETIRYFEKIGLMSAAERQSNGYRRYHHGHVRQLQFIQRCRKLGFSQQEIRDLVAVFEHAEAHTRAEVKAITSSHLQTIRGRIEELQKLETALDDLTKQCEGDHLPASECPILASLSESSFEINGEAGKIEQA